MARPRSKEIVQTWTDFEKADDFPRIKEKEPVVWHVAFRQVLPLGAIFSFRYRPKNEIVEAHAIIGILESILGGSLSDEVVDILGMQDVDFAKDHVFLLSWRARLLAEEGGLLYI